MTVRDLQGTVFGAVTINRLVNHDDGNEYVHLYTGLLSLMTSVDHGSILDAEILCAVPTVLRGNNTPALDITI